MRARASYLLLLPLLTSCAPKGTPGKTNQWVKGATWSVNVSFVNSPFPTEGGSAIVRLRNDGGQAASPMPIRLVAWFSKSGKQESTLAFSQAGGAGLISADLQVLKGEKASRTVKLSAEKQEFTLEPGEEVVLSNSFWKFKTEGGDQIEKLQVLVAQEAFVVD